MNYLVGAALVMGEVIAAALWGFYGLWFANRMSYYRQDWFSYGMFAFAGFFCFFLVQEVLAQWLMLTPLDVADSMRGAAFSGGLVLPVTGVLYEMLCEVR